MSEEQYAPQRSDTNGVGLAGFIVSLLGLVGTCGLLSPIGLVLSLVGLGKEPRGFAIAGTIIGAIGSLWILVAIGVLVLAGAAVAASLIGLLGVAVGLSALGFDDAAEIYNGVQEYYESNGRVPAQLTDVPGVSQQQLTDAWGNQFEYEVVDNGEAYFLRSLGRDGQPGTDDDLELFRRFAPRSEARLKLGQKTIFEGDFGSADGGSGSTNSSGSEAPAEGG